MLILPNIDFAELYSTHCISHAGYYSCQLPIPIIQNNHHISSFIIVIQNHHCHYYCESISCVLLFPTSSSLPTALRQIYLSSAPPYVYIYASFQWPMLMMVMYCVFVYLSFCVFFLCFNSWSYISLIENNNVCNKLVS